MMAPAPATRFRLRLSPPEVTEVDTRLDALPPPLPAFERAELYLDVNGDQTLDAGDVLAARLESIPADGRARFRFDAALPLTANQTRRLLMVVDLATENAR